MKNIKTYEEFKEGVTFKEFLIKYIKLKYSTVTSDVELDCSSNRLIDLNGIEQFVNLDKLWCYSNHLTSLEGIEKSTKLTYIDCWNNNLTSLKPISNLTELKYLYFTVNYITSLDDITNLTKLLALSFNSNEITSLKGIENFTKLKRLDCKMNPIDWIDYVDKKGNKWYTVLPKSIKHLESIEFDTIKEYWEFMEKNQPASVSRKFNF